MATKEIAPIRVWLFATVILVILAALVPPPVWCWTILSHSSPTGFGTVCCAVTTGSFHVSFVPGRRSALYANRHQPYAFRFARLVRMARWYGRNVLDRSTHVA
jgi:hypothetical protein